MTNFEPSPDDAHNVGRLIDGPGVNGPTLLHVTTVPMTLIFLRGEIRHLRGLGYDISVVSSPGAEFDLFQSEEKIRGMPVAMTRRISPVRDLLSLYKLHKLLSSLRPVIVHAHTPKAGILAMLAGWMARVPVRVYHLRGLPMETSRGPSRMLLKAVERLSCRLAHRVFAIGPSLLTTALSEGICSPDKITVLASGQSVDATGRFNPDTVDPEARFAERRRWSIPEEAPVIGFVGRLVRDKGIHELFEAWRSLRISHPEVHLLIVGDFEERDPVAPCVVHALRSDPRVHFTGMRSDVPSAYATMDIVVLPTHREGFPNVPLEAAAMRLPVVATRVPGCVDAVEDGLTGTLVPPYDVSNLTAALKRYLDDENLRVQHGTAGRKRVLAEFKAQPIWDALHIEYQNLLAASGRFQNGGITTPAPR